MNASLNIRLAIAKRQSHETPSFGVHGTGSRPIPDFGNPDAYYEPNQHDDPVANPTVQETPLRIDAAALRHACEVTADHFVWAGALYAEVMDRGEPDRLNANMAAAMAPCSDAVTERCFAVLIRV
ncbi:MAG: hypothetical protein AAF390_18845 [Pseudomonadota bacterium]